MIERGVSKGTVLYLVPLDMNLGEVLWNTSDVVTITSYRLSADKPTATPFEVAYAFESGNQLLLRNYKPVKYSYYDSAFNFYSSGPSLMAWEEMVSECKKRFIDAQPYCDPECRLFKSLQIPYFWHGIWESEKEKKDVRVKKESRA